MVIGVDEYTSVRVPATNFKKACPRGGLFLMSGRWERSFLASCSNQAKHRFAPVQRSAMRVAKSSPRNQTSKPRYPAGFCRFGFGDDGC